MCCKRSSRFRRTSSSRILRKKNDSCKLGNSALSLQLRLPNISLAPRDGNDVSKCCRCQCWTAPSVTTVFDDASDVNHHLKKCFATLLHVWSFHVEFVDINNSPISSEHPDVSCRHKNVYTALIHGWRWRSKADRKSELAYGVANKPDTRANHSTL
jgi:hypothetical protein